MVKYSNCTAQDFVEGRHNEEALQARLFQRQQEKIERLREAMSRQSQQFEGVKHG